MRPAQRRLRAGGAARALSLAAAPTFAAMALASALAGPGEALCTASPFGGMAAMYLLMGVFHAGPWLRLGAPQAA
jgi:hypothetical protein